MLSTSSPLGTRANAPIDVPGGGRVGPAPVRWLLAIVLGVACILVAHALDRSAWAYLRDPRVNERDWARLLRSMGYLPLWIAIAVAVRLHDRVVQRGARRAWLLIVAPALSGLVAEVLKLVVRRLRPDPESFAYVFRAFTDGPLSNRGMGMPSSHVMVAVAGAAALARLFPESRWLWYALAAGCALTRIMSLGHYLSDTVVAAAVALLLSWALFRKWPPG